MSKRFRDTGLWDKEWYVALSCSERCAMDYILCRCDPVGVWSPAFTVAERMIGEKVDWQELPNKVNGNLRVLGSGKWWAVDFCKYQYGRIHEGSESKIQRTLHSLLVSHGLWESYLSTLTPTVDPTVQDKEQDKEKVKEKESYADAVLLTRDEYAKLVARAGEKHVKAAIEKLSHYKLASGKTYKSDYDAILSWALGEVMGQKGRVPMVVKQEECSECHVRGGSHGVSCSRKGTA